MEEQELSCESLNHRGDSLKAVEPWQCARCEKWLCTGCEGGSGGDEVLDALCDSCWCVESMLRGDI